MKELSDQQRVLIAFALMLLILFVWGKFFKPTPPPPSTAQKSGQVSTEMPAQATNQAAATTTPSVETILPPPAGAIQASEEQIIVIESSLYRVQITNRGGLAQSWKLKKYLNDDKPPQPLALVNIPASRQIGAWPLSFALEDSAAELKANTVLYKIGTSPVSRYTLEAPGAITLTWG